MTEVREMALHAGTAGDEWESGIEMRAGNILQASEGKVIVPGSLLSVGWDDEPHINGAHDIHSRN